MADAKTLYTNFYKNRLQEVQHCIDARISELDGRAQKLKGCDLNENDELEALRQTSTAQLWKVRDDIERLLCVI
jgi:hypothetical protein